MQFIKFLLIIFSLAAAQTACRRIETADAVAPTETNPVKTNDAANEIQPNLPKPATARSFAYPIGKTAFITETKDADEWYNAQNFGENRHLGEDWNQNTGGDSDCGQPVFAVGNGRIVYAGDAGSGWGNVVIIEHFLPDGTRVQSLYGHLAKIEKSAGEVKKRELIGTVGNANGRYLCHLHFEIRATDCPFWNQPGQGYSETSTGWLDPSEFIDKHRR